MPRTEQEQFTILQAARISLDIYGAEATEEMLREVYELAPDQVIGVMQRLNASQN